MRAIHEAGLKGPGEDDGEYGSADEEEHKAPLPTAEVQACIDRIAEEEKSLRALSLVKNPTEQLLQLQRVVDLLLGIEGRPFE